MWLVCPNKNCRTRNKGVAYSWDYQGKGEVVASCPKCRSKVPITSPSVKEEGVLTLLYQMSRMTSGNTSEASLAFLNGIFQLREFLPKAENFSDAGTNFYNSLQNIDMQEADAVQKRTAEMESLKDLLNALNNEWSRLADQLQKAFDLLRGMSLLDESPTEGVAGGEDRVS